MSLRGPRSRAGLAALALALLAPLGLAGCDDGPAAHQRPPVERHGTLAVIGDSVMAGPNPADPDLGLGDQLAEDLKMHFENFSVGGTGYLRKGPEGDQSFVSQARAAVKVDADLYVVYGGANDWLDLYLAHTKKLKDLVAAARTTFRLLAAKAGPDHVVVIGPIWPKFPIVKSARKLRDALAEQAQAAGLPFVDPIREQWLTPENDEEMLGPDRVHPSKAGQVYFADLMATAIDEAVGPVG
jgi:lysophospholipase L1-like esterase